MIRGSTPLAAVIGSPVGHSLSPPIHRAGFADSGLDWQYVAFDVEPGDGPAALAAMRTLGLVGLSVTMPHKQDVAAAVDRLDPAATALAAVNTVSWDGEELVGSNTDGDGFVMSLSEHDVAVAGRRVAVLGAGGAARAVVDALARHGAARIDVVNRTTSTAEVCAALSPLAHVGTTEVVAEADIVVNATSVGMGAVDAASGPLPCDADLLGADQVVADLVYHPLVTPWLRRAAQAGAGVVDGLGMLVCQAALQQEIWTGRRPRTDTLRSAAEAELARRHR